MVARKPTTSDDIHRLTVLMSSDAKKLLKRISLERSENVSEIVREILDEWLLTVTLPPGVTLPRRLLGLRKARQERRA